LILKFHLLCSSLFFLSSPPISISCLWWDSRVKDLSLVLLPLLCASVCALHEDSWKLKSCELVTLGSLDPRRLCGGWTLVWSLEAVREPPIHCGLCLELLLRAVREPPTHCGLCLGLLLKGSGFGLEGIPIVEGEPNLCGAVHRRRG